MRVCSVCAHIYGKSIDISTRYVVVICMEAGRLSLGGIIRQIDAPERRGAEGRALP